VAAGQPIEAILSHDTVPVPKDMQGATYICFARAGGFDDRRKHTGRRHNHRRLTKDGGKRQVVVALIDGNYATVKKFYRERFHSFGTC